MTTINTKYIKGEWFLRWMEHVTTPYSQPVLFAITNQNRYYGDEIIINYSLN